jgi:hypothetical protein
MTSAQATQVFELLINEALKKGIFDDLKNALVCANALKVLQDEHTNRTTDTSSSDSINHGNS